MRRAWLSIFVGILISVLYPGGAAWADFKIDVSPTSYNWQLDPGGSLDDTLTVSNPGTTPITVKLQVFRFHVPNDDNEDSKPVVDEGDANPYNGAITVEISPGDFQLDSHEQRLVKLRVKASAAAKPGSYLLSVQATVGTNSASTGQSHLKDAPIQVGQQTISKLVVPAVTLIRGKVNLQGKIESFTTDQSVYQDGPVMFRLAFHNGGDSHYQIKPTIVIQHAGGQVARIPLDPKIVLPGRSRIISYRWDKHNLDGGSYDARAVVAYGTDAQRSALAQTSFRVVGHTFTRILLPIFGGLIVSYLLVRLLGRKGRRKRRRGS